MRRAIALLAVCAAALATVGTTAAPAQAAPAERRAPVVDECYDYAAPARNSRAAQKRIARSAPVDCATSHTAQTYWVGTLKDSFGNPARASGAARAATTKPCSARALAAYLGLSNRTIPSRFQTVSVFPSRAQWRNGERWVRCDAILRGGRGFTKVKGSFASLIATTDPTRFDFCTPGVPGSRTTAAYLCTKPKKNWVMIREVEIAGAQKRFPGRRAVERKSKSICEKAGKAYSAGARFHAWWAIWPTRVGWRTGDRTAQCFVPLADYLQATREPAPEPTTSP